MGELGVHFNDQVILPLQDQRVNEVFPAHELIKVPGRQAGSKVFYHRGYKYWHVGDGRPVLSCACKITSSCSGRIYVNPNGSFYLKALHTGHDPDMYLLEETNMRRYIQHSAEATMKTPDEIYTMAALRYENAARTIITKSTAKDIIYRKRARSRPAIPRTVEELEGPFTDYRFSSGSYRGKVSAENGGVAHIFISDAMLEQLRTAVHIHVDGTFKCTADLTVGDWQFQVATNEHVALVREGHAIHGGDARGALYGNILNSSDEEPDQPQPANNNPVQPRRRRRRRLN